MRGRPAAAVVAVVLLAVGVDWSSAQVPPPPEGAPMTPALERLLARREVTHIADGFQYAEGPLWHPEGHLLFADSPRSRIYRWHPDEGLRVFREPSAGATALAIDAEGRLLATEHHNRRIARIGRDGSVVTVVDRYEGRRLNSPNDLVVAADGSIYFTDPPYGLPKQTEGKELDFQGVYRLSPAGALTLLVRDLPRPNGIGLSPDGTALYLTDSDRGELLVLSLSAGVEPAVPRVLAAVKPWKPGMQGVPDGLAVASTGHIFVTGPGGVWVFDENGGRLGIIATPETPAACAFGGEDGKTLFITARSRVYRVGLRVTGS